jgi:hypothetical protein
LNIRHCGISWVLEMSIHFIPENEVHRFVDRISVLNKITSSQSNFYLLFRFLPQLGSLLLRDYIPNTLSPFDLLSTALSRN